jgi:soluble lytic murein transglycosylase-like protein
VKLVFAALLALPLFAQSPADSIRKQLASIAAQRESVRKQAEVAARYRISRESAVLPDADCDPLPEIELAPILDAAAQAHQVQTKLLRAVIERESGARPCVVSPKGASGLMQLMPATVEKFKVADPFDPKQNVEAGAEFLKQLLDKYKGDLSLVLAAFNAGPAAVDEAGGNIPEIQETKDYVNAILQKLRAAEPDR